jgi:hypothetical protein
MGTGGGNYEVAVVFLRSRLSIARRYLGTHDNGVVACAIHAAQWRILDNKHRHTSRNQHSLQMLRQTAHRP